MARAMNPVGVFDSGVGGISVLAELRRVLPREDFLFYGDTAHAPYGTKRPEEVLGFVRGVMAHLMDRGVKAVVIACNTATSVAAEELRRQSEIPIIGMEPALKPAHELRHGGQILVMATPMTLRLPKFQRLMERYGEGAEPLPCPGLMDLVEQENFTQAKQYLREHFAPYDMTRVDAVVLGCTHYTFLRPVLAELLPDRVPVLDGNLGTARQLARVLESRALLNPNGAGCITLETSGDPAVVLPVMERLLHRA
ncbi:MAG: glutamate racemase [Aristaeellaceae bacterium]